MHLRTSVFREELQRAKIGNEAIHQHTSGWETLESIQDYKETMANWLKDEAMYYRVALLGGRVAGLCIARIGTETTPNELRVIQLSREIRRRGFGRAILGDFEQKSNPLAPTRLDVIAENEPAISFYSSLGYEMTGGVSFFYISDQIVPVLEMQKDARL